MWEWGTCTHIHIRTHMHMHTRRRTHAHTHTIGTGGMCKYDDVINGPVVVLGRRRILEYRGHLQSQVNQMGGVDHGHGKSAVSLPFLCRKIQVSPHIVSLRGRGGEGRGKEGREG